VRGLAVLLLAGIWVPAAAPAKPLVAIPDREVAVEVAVKDGIIDVKFGFRVRGKAEALWKYMTAFQDYPRFVETVKKVRVKRHKGNVRVTLRGTLLDDYRIQVVARTSFRENQGWVRWKVLGTRPPNTGEMRVEQDGDTALFSLATQAKKEIDLPDFMVEVGLRTAIKALAESIRRNLESQK
jgi:uncharacterized membrane protein